MARAGGGERSASVRAWTSEILASLALAWPLVLSNLAGTALTTVDVVLIGRLGPEPLAAAALATSLYITVLLTGIGLVVAVSPMVASEYGRRRHAVREIRRTVRQGGWMALAYCVPAGLALGQGDAILVAIGQDPGLAAAAAGYLDVLLLALLPQLLFALLRAFTSSLNRPLPSLVVALLALPVNLGLAWALIFGHAGLPALGLPGAALATNITAWLAVLGLAAVILRDRRLRRYRVFGRFWRADWPRFRALWRLGVPISGTLALETALFSGSGLVMGLIGAAALAAHTIALQIASLCFMVPLGLAQAATIRVGQAFGAGDRAAVGRAGWAACGIALGFTACTAVLLFALPRTLVSLFLDVDAAANAATVELALGYLAFAALFQLVDGSQAVGAGMLRGLRDTRMPMIYAAIGYWALGAPLGLGLAFAAGWGGRGVWAGLAIGLAAVAGLTIRRWTRREPLGLVPVPAGPGGPALPAG